MDQETFGFDHALRLLNEGRRVARRGWNGWKNGKHFVVVKQKGYPEGIAINKNTAEAYGFPEGTIFKFAPYLQLLVTVDAGKTEDIERTGYMYAPSQLDMLSGDWFEVTA